MRARFTPPDIPWDAQNLVIGTSRTKHLRGQDVGATVHSYRGAKIQDLFEVVLQYPPLDLHSVTLIGGFNDHSTQSAYFLIIYQALIDLIKYKFKPRVILAPKIIECCHNNVINKKLYSLNLSLFNFINNYSYIHNYYPLIVSPYFMLNKKFFCFDGVHFSRFGNMMFSKMLNTFISRL